MSDIAGAGTASAQSFMKIIPPGVLDKFRGRVFGISPSALGCAWKEDYQLSAEERRAGAAFMQECWVAVSVSVKPFSNRAVRLVTMDVGVVPRFKDAHGTSMQRCVQMSVGDSAEFVRKTLFAPGNVDEVFDAGIHVTVPVGGEGAFCHVLRLVATFGGGRYAAFCRAECNWNVSSWSCPLKISVLVCDLASRRLCMDKVFSSEPALLHGGDRHWEIRVQGDSDRKDVGNGYVQAYIEHLAAIQIAKGCGDGPPDCSPILLRAALPYPSAQEGRRSFMDLVPPEVRTTFIRRVYSLPHHHNEPDLHIKLGVDHLPPYLPRPVFFDARIHVLGQEHNRNTLCFALAEDDTEWQNCEDCQRDTVQATLQEDLLRAMHEAVDFCMKDVFPENSMHDLFRASPELHESCDDFRQVAYIFATFSGGRYAAACEVACAWNINESHDVEIHVIVYDLHAMGGGEGAGQIFEDMPEDEYTRRIWERCILAGSHAKGEMSQDELSKYVQRLALLQRCNPSSQYVAAPAPVVG